MVDGGAGFRRATDLGRIDAVLLRPTVATRELQIGTADLLGPVLDGRGRPRGSEQEQVDWFRFRASGRGVNSLSALATHVGVVGDDVGGGQGEDTSFTPTTRASIYFQRAGESGFGRRVGILEGSRSESRFVYPKGAGTYYIKITRAPSATSRNLAYSFSLRFVRSNLTPGDEPDGRQLFF